MKILLASLVCATSLLAHFQTVMTDQSVVEQKKSESFDSIRVYAPV
ncbi:MAG: hypothetical protein LRY52_12865 [Sulfurospirillum cavolei]|nr:hypothetical protein [Sulfurospirillum cavolei]